MSEPTLTSDQSILFINLDETDLLPQIIPKFSLSFLTQVPFGRVKLHVVQSEEELSEVEESLIERSGFEKFFDERGGEGFFAFEVRGESGEDRRFPAPDD